MKRCPVCRRSYSDETLNFCLDDGSALAGHPGSVDEVTTAILSSGSFAPAASPVASGSFGASLNSIAVLPFANMSADTENEYFCDGLAEELINALAKISDLRVAARTSAFSFKGKNTDIEEIARRLGVKTILDGSVRRAGDRIRITVQLVETSNGYHLWSERFDRVMDDIFDIQDEITAAVVIALKVKLLGGSEVRRVRRPTQNAEAYELYLKGRYNWNKMEGAALERAVHYYQQALELDADYALAYAGLSDAYVLLVNHAGAPLKETIPMAASAAAKAIELDPELADGYTSLGLVKTFYDWDWEVAERLLHRAVELNPRSSHARHILGIRLCLGGFIDEAAEHFRIARELDPLSPSINEHLAWPYYYSRDYEPAIAQFENTIEMEPGFKNVHFRLGLAYLQMGMYEKAIAKIQDAQKLSFDRDAVAWQGYAYALMGREMDARAVLANLKELATERYVPSYGFALIHLGLGEKDEAFEWLEKGASEHDYWLAFVLIDPDLDVLRDDPRFDRLIKLVGFPEAGKVQS
jgi:TolB-like protein/Flp pilus assembly protein TadD